MFRTFTGTVYVDFLLKKKPGIVNSVMIIIAKKFEESWEKLIVPKERYMYCLEFSKLLLLMQVSKLSFNNKFCFARYIRKKITSLSLLILHSSEYINCTAIIK